MKRIVLSIVGLALTFGVIPVTVQGQGTGPKLGFVDSRLILQSTPGYQAADSQFTRELASWRAEIQRLQASLDSAARDFEQSSVVLSPSARDSKRQELMTQQATLEQRASELEGRASDRQRELLDPIEQRVNGAIETVREAGGYAFIFDVGSPGNGIVAADRALDLTQLVLQELGQPAN